MAPLFSKVNSYKLGHNVQNEVSLICAKFSKDLFNISQVIALKQSGPVFWPTLYIYRDGSVESPVTGIADLATLRRANCIAVVTWPDVE